MKIIVDNKQEEALMQSLCDVALRVEGLKNLTGVQIVLAAIEVKKPEKKKPEKKPEKRQ